MTTGQRTKSVWVVVAVESGVPVAVHAYRDRRVASSAEGLLRRRMRPDNDETGLFRMRLPKDI